MVYNKNVFVFYPILMKLGEVVVQMATTTSHELSSKLDEKQKVFIIDHLTEV